MLNRILIINKPAGMTSHDVVARVRRVLGERGVGHLGTLDPMATGVLPIVTGRYTRLAQFFGSSRKSYDGEIRFGFTTDTYDAEGEPVGPCVEIQPQLHDVRTVAACFSGMIAQLPPAYSAKKINGVPAYKLARKDKPVELRPVEVQIHRFEILSVIGDRARFVAEVSAGTYIRSLAHDLGQKLGYGAHLTELRRTASGEFTLDQAVKLDELTPEMPGVHSRMILSEIPCVTAPAEVITALRNGRAVNLPEFSTARLVKVFADQTRIVAIAERLAGTLFRPHVVLYGNNEQMD